MEYSVESLQRHLQSLRLAKTSKELPSFLRKAELHSWTYQEFLREILHMRKNVEKRK